MLPFEKYSSFMYGLKTLLALVIVVVAAVAASFGAFSYYSMIQQSSNRPSKVTWFDASGSIISSITVTSRSSTIGFTCTPDTGPVDLRLTPSLSEVLTLSQISFPSCPSSGNIRNSVTMTAQSSASASGTLQVRQQDVYRTLAPPLQVTVQTS